MTRSIIVVLILSSIKLFAQSDSKWELGPEFSYDNISYEYLNNPNLWVSGSTPNFSFGVKLNYFINQKVGISSGALYANRDYTTFLNCMQRPLCDPASPKTSHYRIIAIPITINYKIPLDKIKPSFELGVRNNFKISSTSSVFNNKTYFLEGFAGLEIKYQIIEKINLGIAYQYARSITELNFPDVLAMNIHSIKLRLGYMLGK